MRGEGGGRKHCFANFCSLALGVVGWGRKSYLGLAKIASFYSQDLSRRNKHDSFWLVSTGYFLPLEIHKHLVPPLSSITLTTNSHPRRFPFL